MIGTDAAGTDALSNGSDDIIIQGASVNWIGVNTVYGPESADQRNVISGSGRGNTDGVFVEGAGTDGNVIAGNFIGLNAAGNAAIPNGDSGVQVYNGATNTRIGTNPNSPNPLERNVISGNLNDNGVLLWGAGAGTVIAGNYIGTDPTGTYGIGNGPTPQAGGEGVAVVGTQGAGVTIGGTVAGAGNVISDNYEGVIITDSGGAGTWNVLVEGNLIGTNAAGNAAIPNTSFGIQIGDAAPNQCAHKHDRRHHRRGHEFDLGQWGRRHRVRTAPPLPGTWWKETSSGPISRAPRRLPTAVMVC